MMVPAPAQCQDPTCYRRSRQVERVAAVGVAREEVAKEQVAK